MEPILTAEKVLEAYSVLVVEVWLCFSGSGTILPISKSCLVSSSSWAAIEYWSTLAGKVKSLLNSLLSSSTLCASLLLPVTIRRLPSVRMSKPDFKTVNKNFTQSLENLKNIEKLLFNYNKICHY
ncbi:hypothetical protein BpHYR1_022141 [Brachionus plicatilis]|uniref:Uncharacterized protein n=1 Tax=Brachionus plicatilis TaxID=10195 RepID=A0A3M7P781_BRAPC|nr:hypothetical protein BpHYR1_022141 [Brachionus plicatilis]